jgi:hypothetical protein
MVPGITASFFVPFTGDKGLFRCQPSSYTLSPPTADVRDSELIFKFVEVAENVGAAKQRFDRELANVKQYLHWLSNDVQGLNASLRSVAIEAIQERRRRLSTLSQGTNALGLTIRRPGAAQPPAPRPAGGSAAVEQRPAAMPSYEVALSFAGENRPFVEDVAEGLKAAGVSVFYDKFEQAQLWGKNLIDHLAEIYRHKSRYVVMFISEHYVRKAWPQHERQHAQERQLVASAEYILPARFDDTAVPGMTNTVSHIDLRSTTAAELVQLILGKLGRQ